MTKPALTTKQIQHLLDKMASSFAVDVGDESVARYYMPGSRYNVFRVFDHEYSYLEHATGSWVQHAMVCDSVTGYRGDADCHEVTLQDAQAWVEENHPDLSVVWL